MKNLNILLVTAMLFSVGAKAASEASIVKTNENFRGTMICNEKGRGLSLTVVNTKTNATVLNLKFDQEKPARNFDFKNETVAVKVGLWTFEYQIADAKCKKCNAQLEGKCDKYVIGALVAAKLAGFIPVKGKSAPVNQK